MPMSEALLEKRLAASKSNRLISISVECILHHRADILIIFHYVNSFGLQGFFLLRPKCISILVYYTAAGNIIV